MHERDRSGPLVVARVLSRDAVVGAEMQHTVQKVIAVCTEPLPPTERGRPLWKPLSQVVVRLIPGIATAPAHMQVKDDAHLAKNWREAWSSKQGITVRSRYRNLVNKKE